MEITKQAHAYLEQLLATGLYGNTVEDVLEGLLYSKLAELLKDGTLVKVLQTPAMTGPRCPRCGSPRLNPLLAMGRSELQCLDCDQRFEGELSA